MNKPTNYGELSSSEKYKFYSSLKEEYLDSFLSSLTSEEKKELYLEGKRLEKEEKERKISEYVKRVLPKMKANVDKMIKESEETGNPLFHICR